jgi:hypothetical protein
VNEGREQGIQQAKRCHANSYAVHDQRANEILHDDLVTMSRQPQGLDKLGQIASN